MAKTPIPRILVPLLMLLAALQPALAGPPDPIVGTWAAADEDGDVGALVSMGDMGGPFVGRITKLFPAPGDPANPTCDTCTGARMGAPLMGLTVVEGLRRQGAGYEGGRILDPDTGTQYQLKAQLGDDGRTLTIRAFAGVALLGRTQTWRRQP